MTKRLNIALFILLLWYPLRITAQFIVFQDTQQYIWIIEGNTVRCLDGYSEQIFSPTNGLPNTSIRTIFFDSHKRLWLFGENAPALVYLDSLHKVHTLYPDFGAHNFNIEKIGALGDTLFFEDTKKSIWVFIKNQESVQRFSDEKPSFLVATYAKEQLPENSSLFYDKQTKTIRSKTQPLPTVLNQSFKTACLLSGQTLLLATTDNALFLSANDKKTQRITLTTKGLSEFREQDLSITSLETQGEWVFIGTNKGLVVLKKNDLAKTQIALHAAGYNITTTKSQPLEPAANYVRLGKIHQIVPNTSGKSREYQEGVVVATENGLFLWEKDNQLKRLTEKYEHIGAAINTDIFAINDSLVLENKHRLKTNNRIIDLTFDKQSQTIWGITETSGVFYCSKKTVKPVPELQDINFTQIEMDNTGKLQNKQGGVVWALSKKQLVKIKPVGNSFKTERFDIPEGTQYFLQEGNIIHLLGIKGLFSTLKISLKIPLEPPCIQLKSIKIGGVEKSISDTEFDNLEMADRTIIAQVSGVSPQSQGDITYAYRFIPLDFTNNWFGEMDTSVTYTPNRELIQPVHAGKYRLEISAINKYGVHAAQPLIRRFTVAPPIWGRLWFWLLSISIVGVIIYSIFKMREQRFRQRNKEIKMERNLVEFELKALQTQMDAHFVANILTAIQGFIQNRERSVANKYIVDFYKLIRLFLDSSIDDFHSLDKEMELLEKYILLKQLLIPFEFKGFDIGQDDEDDYFDTMQINVPTSVYQPFVENAIEHGLSRRKENEMRLLSISFRQEIDSDIVTCVIEDTGIGRTKAEANRIENKTRESFTKQVSSKIIKKRAKTLNAIDPNTLEYTYEDLTDETGTIATGTRVIIKTKFTFNK